MSGLGRFASVQPYGTKHENAGHAANIACFTEHWRYTAMTALYFIRAGDDGPIKIGKSLNVQARLKNIQGGNHLPLMLITSIPNRGWEEMCWHKALPGHRLVGEWFEPIPQLLEAITVAQDYGPWWEVLPIPQSFVEDGWAGVAEASLRAGWGEHMEGVVTKAFNDARILSSVRNEPPPVFKRNRRLYWEMAQAA